MPFGDPWWERPFPNGAMTLGKEEDEVSFGLGHGGGEG